MTIGVCSIALREKGSSRLMLIPLSVSRYSSNSLNNIESEEERILLRYASY